jgi:hypothetical protein
VEYIPDEVFLVAGITDPNQLYSPTDGVYTGAYTYDEAVQKCKAYGGDLATQADLTTARDVSGHWCLRGWIQGDRANTYGISPYPNGCAGQSSRNSFSAAAINGKGYAICKGKKPAYLTTTDVQDFNKDSYGMLSDAVVEHVMTGAPTDGTIKGSIFPRTFTRSQALWALSQPGPAYKNPKAARDLLIAQAETDEAAPTLTDSEQNRKIAKIVKPGTVESTTDSTAWNTNAKTQTCTAFQGIVTDIKTKIRTIQSLFRDISGMVVSSINMKTENGYLQSAIAGICNEGRQTQACMRLLALDFDIFYKNKSKDPTVKSYVINDLEDLNLALQMRECELQQILGSIEQLNSVIGSGCSIDTRMPEAGYTTNRINGKPITCKDEDQTYLNAKGNEAIKNATLKLGRDINYNGVDKLKKALEQISPYYSSAQFNDLVTLILDRLNQILEPPDSTTFLKYNSVFDKSRKNMDILKNLLGVS